MTEAEFKARTKEFAHRAVRMAEALPRSRASQVVAMQLIRAATSVAANYRSACRSRSAADFRNKLAQAINLPELRKQKSQVEEYVTQLEKQLPGKAEMDALLSEINQAGVGRGLQFELFKPGQLQLTEHYAELPIAIKLTGNYHALAGFVSDIANLPRIVTIDNLSISQQKDGQIFEAIVHTYRYLDKAEVEAQKKHQEDLQKGKKR